MGRIVLLAVWLLSLGTVLYGQAPTVASSSVVFSNTYCNRTDISWTSGNGQGRLLIMRKAASVNDAPDNNTYYIPRDTFGKAASMISSGNYVVYNSTGNSVIVYGLEANTTYHIAIFEYNGSGSNFNYLTGEYAEDSFTTEYLYADFDFNESYQCDFENEFEFYENVTQSKDTARNFSWNFGDGYTSNLRNPTHEYAAYGIYNVNLTVTSTGCSHTIIKKDTVAPIPIVDLVLNPDTPNNNVVQCFFNQDGSINRFAYLINLINPALATPWDQAVVNLKYGDGTSTSQLKGRKTYNQPGTYRVSVVVNTAKTVYTNSIFCTDSAHLFVEVKPRPLNPNRIDFSDTAMCEKGNLFTFSNNTGVPGSPKWYFGDGDSTASNIASHFYRNPGKYNVRFTFIDTSGCFDEYSDSIRVIPQPDNYFSGLNSTYCQHDNPAQLNADPGGGFFIGDQVNNVTSRFNPVQVGENTVSYVVQEGACRDTFTRTTIVLPRPLFNLGGDTSICEGTNVNKSLSRDSSSIIWNTGSNDSFININTAGLYWAEKNNGICSFRDSINVRVIAAPDITLGHDTTLCGGSLSTVNIQADEASYVWNDGYTDPFRILDQTGYYRVVVSNNCGSDTAEIDLVILEYPCDIYVPNAFTPGNGDGLNDFFRASGNVEVIEMLIFNRWGELIFQSNDSSPKWDGYYEGKLVQPGAYLAVIYYKMPVQDVMIQKTFSTVLNVLY